MILLRVFLLFYLSVYSPADRDSSADAENADGSNSGSPILMETKETVIVRQAMLQKSAASARIYEGTIIRVIPRGKSLDCKMGWMERLGGGFICAKKLKNTDSVEPRVNSIDNPNLIDGFSAYKVLTGGAELFKGIKTIDDDRPFVKLRRGSVLVVQDELKRKGELYFKTRQGWFVESENLEKLPPRIETLAVMVAKQEQPPIGITISPAAVFDSPSQSGRVVDMLERYKTVQQDKASPEVIDGWIKLGQGHYLKDEDMARYQKPPRKDKPASGERWIAVDLKEQLLHAYQGEKLVMIVPCSTGKNGNTRPGKYHIQLKRRSQTMTLRFGQVRVEDVQWVMYYNRDDSIAIHSAYWHSDFGKPISHGCVNLPIQDAKWLFEWSTPHVLPEDSERFPTPGNPGSMVFVF